MPETGSHTPHSRLRMSKAAVREILSERHLDRLRQWVRHSRSPFRILNRLLYETDELLRWRAIEAVGIAAGIKYADDPESARELVRKYFWMMNDESGNLCRSAPEAIAEVLVNIPQLIDEYGPLMIAYLEEEPFERGAHWAIARIASVRSDIYEDNVDKLARSLDNPDRQIRGYTVMALKAIGTERRLSSEDARFGDSSRIMVYDFEAGNLRELT